MVNLKDIVEPNTTPEVDMIFNEAIRKSEEEMAEVMRGCEKLNQKSY